MTARQVATAVGRRTARLFVTLFAVSVATFSLTALLPGDPALQILGAEGATPEALAAVRADMRLDEPVLSRYASWMGDIARGDLGTSYQSGRSVASQIGARLPVTLEIIGLAITIAVLAAVPLGVVSAWKANHLVGRLISGATSALLAMPSLVVGIVLILLFAVRLGVLPASGWEAFADDPVENLRRAILPAFALALPQIAVLTRVLRGDMTATLDQDFVSFADSKGLSTSRILLGHALRPSSFSLVTLVGLSIGFFMGGAVVVERMFNVPGLGTLLVNAIYQRDLVLVQGVTLFIAAVFVAVNFVVDCVYALLDPRIRRGAVNAAV